MATQDWLGNDTVSNDIARYAIGEQDADNKVLALVEGVYEESIAETIGEKMRLCHRIKLREPIGDNARIILWGNARIDGTLPCLAPGTKVRVEYKGVKKLGGGRTMKDITVRWPADAKTRPHPYAVKEKVSADSQEEPVPF